MKKRLFGIIGGVLVLILLSPLALLGNQIPFVWEVCFTPGMKLDASTGLGGLPESDRSWLRDQIQEVSEDLAEVESEYRKQYRKLESNWQNQSGLRLESTAEELGKLEGERLALHLGLENRIRNRLGKETYQQYRTQIRQRLSQQVQSNLHELFRKNRNLKNDSTSDTLPVISWISLVDMTTGICDGLPRRENSSS